MRVTLYEIPLPERVRGRLSTMAQPRGGDRLDDEMATLRAIGVDVLVSLQTADERREAGLVDEPAAAVRAGLEFHQLPIVDLGVPDRDGLAPFASRLVDLILAGKHVAVHCWAGIGRSSVVAGAVLVRLGVPADRVWAIIGRARGCSVPETDEQRQWLTGHPVRSPHVVSVSWGRIEIAGLGTYKDAKLYPGGGRAWDWGETGTRHRPGIQSADVEELLARGASTVVLSRGMQLQLEVAGETLTLLRERGVSVYVAETTDAVARYNELAESTLVGGLFHTTC